MDYGLSLSEYLQFKSNCKEAKSMQRNTVFEEHISLLIFRIMNEAH